MNTKATFVSFLLDETGSMESIKDDTIGGFNSYVDTLKKDGEGILFSLVSFHSNETKKRYVAVPINDVQRLTADDYIPQAMTPLIDASVKIIKATAEAVEQRTDDPNVVIVMQTDGQENVSVEYTNADLAALIKEKTAAGWQFVFLGAGLDAFSAARQAGIAIDANQVIAYGRDRSQQVFAATAANVKKFAQAGDVSALHYSPEQRAEAGDAYADQYLNQEPARTEKKDKKKGGRSSTADDIHLA